MIPKHQCQAVIDGKRCNNLAISRELAQGEKGKVFSVYVCADCLQQSNRGKVSPAGRLAFPESLEAKQ
jgi:hypothetical protein